MSTSTSRQSRPCVLVVIDDPVSRELLQHVLHLGGFTPLPASTGERALLELRGSRQAIDWLVTTRDLPGLVDGFILADEFQAVHPSRCALILSDGSAASSSEVVARLRALAFPDTTVQSSPEAEHRQALAA